MGRTTDAAGTVRREFGKDIAILKIDAHDLPVVRLARYSTNLHLGQALFVIGFPGVVASHELLSAESRFEPSVTVRRVSGFKQDVGGQRVIQTDASVIQGNSGGPVFDDRGHVTTSRRVADAANRLGRSLPLPAVSPVLRETLRYASMDVRGERDRPHPRRLRPVECDEPGGADGSPGRRLHLHRAPLPAFASRGS